MTSYLEMHGLTIQEGFERYHETNPQVYDALVRLARKAKRRGFEKIGIELLYCVMRWEEGPPANDPSTPLKYNDAYTSRYARLISTQEKDLKDLFKLHKLRDGS